MKEGKQQPEPRPPDRPEVDVPLSARAKGRARRCPVCHDDVGRGPNRSRCGQCGARYHLGCLGESRATACQLCGGRVASESMRVGRQLLEQQRERRVRTIAQAVGGIVALISLWPGCMISVGIAYLFGWAPEGKISGAPVVFLLLGTLLAPVIAAPLSMRLVRWIANRRAKGEAPAP